MPSKMPGLSPRKRGRLSKSVVASLAGLAGVTCFAAPALADNCTDLAEGVLVNGRITAAQSIPAGNYTAGDGVTYANLPAFCRVAATLTPTSESNIKIELWMPSASGAWNGRFVGTGNGGYAGAIVYSELASTLALGFAAVNTDMGTSPANVLNGKPLTGFRQKQIDFGYRSTHLMTVAGKEITQAFYNKAAKYSFFTGCSTGGGQALHEAEQFPDDYDGIVGGAPAENRTHLHVDILWDYAVTHLTPQSLVPEPLLETVTASVIAACGVRSGSLPTDPFLTDPRVCHWNAQSLLCKSGQTANCLTPQQANAINLIYDGPHNPRTGALIYPGPNRGSESGALFDFAAQEGLVFGQTEPTFDGLFYWAFGPNFDWTTFDFDHDVAKLDQVLAPIANANNADLSAFERHGGKLVLYHGWADSLVPPQDDINYFLRVAAAHNESVANGYGGLTKTLQSSRLFMAPGMGHCFGGPGPNVFGGADNPGGPADPAHNVLLALQRWVEHGQAPDQIIATKYPADNLTQPPAMTRPLCVFPKVPIYSGSGDTTDAASFVCAESLVPNPPMPPPVYLK